ncbi:sensor histidine kinase [Paractinoplanes maris]|uniref:sensor histidine kinase n=1 Tax=Paractinoplanes maris TaxID=1734446 RepID=UPI0020212E1E|nr:DUF4118 domain-containing protein [Actinoplanes maris]
MTGSPRPHPAGGAGGVALARRRVAAGFAVTLIGLPVLTAAAAAAGLELAGGSLVFLAAVVGVALLGGRWPALLAAVGGFLLLNYFFTAPVRTFAVNTGQGALALIVFVVVALAVSWVVDVAARRARQAAAASADARILAAVAGGVLAGPDPLRGLLKELRELFGLESVVLSERAGDGWARVADSDIPEVSDSSPATRVRAADDLVLSLRGRPLDDNEHRIAQAFAAQAAVALRQQRLATAAEGDRVRAALLAAVSHDLRTPLAAAKAAVAGLRGDEVHFDEDDRRELLATADESLDRLGALLANLLDMSRLQAGALAAHPVDVGLEDVVPAALDELGPAGRRITVRLPDDLPTAHADPGLLARVLVNVTGNALRHSPADRPPEVTGRASGDRVELHVVDHGPGVPAGDRERIFQAFQRLGDRDNHTGVGLGLALSRGLTEAMGGTLIPQETPGGGLTMVLTLPAGPR